MKYFVLTVSSVEIAISTNILFSSIFAHMRMKDFWKTVACIKQKIFRNVSHVVKTKDGDK